MRVCLSCETEKEDRKFWRGRRTCTACAARRISPEKRREYRLKNLEKFRERTRRWRALNPERSRELQRKADRKRLSNPEYRKRRSAEALARIYANWDKHLLRQSLRYALKKGHMPTWADESEIRKIYESAQRLSKETGVKHQVDHIVPLVSRIVCGLHCEANLQILSAVANMAKGNRHWPNMPSPDSKPVPSGR